MHVDEPTLHAYLDDELDAAARAAVEQHVAGCPACRARLAQWRGLFATVEAVPDVAAVPDVSERVLAELASQQAPRWLRPLLVAQVAAALLLLAWLWPSLWEALARPFWAGLAMPRLPAPEWATALAAWPSRWLSTGLADLVGAWPDIDLPVLALTTSQWAVLAGLVAVAWLLSNGWLLKKETRKIGLAAGNGQSANGA